MTMDNGSIAKLQQVVGELQQVVGELQQVGR
jgi:hypothetical protein